MRPWLVAVTAVLAAACASGPAVPPPAPADVVVGSFDFDESHLLAEIYAQALEGEGLTVRRELDLGPRELVLPALRRGLVDLVPEYAGSALDATEPERSQALTSASAIAAALDAALAPWGLTTLAPSAASNQNVLVVGSETAEAEGLGAISDLDELAAGLVIGGPPECPERPRCLAGLTRRYGLAFREFVSLAGADLVAQALADGVVDVGVLFSTDAVLADEGFTALDDDRRLQPPDPVVPVVRTAVLADARIERTLDAVSGRLTTQGLRFLNWRVARAGTDIAAEAHGWLVRQDLVDR